MLDDIEKYINQIELCENEQELQTLASALKITSNLINRISVKVSSNDQQIKSLVVQNTDEIINLFKNIKQLKEELKKSRRNFDAIDSHLDVLKRKYIDTSDKMIKSTISKSNIDFTLKVIEKLKNFISEVKLMKNYYEKDISFLLDSETPLKCFMSLSNFLNKELKEMKSYLNVNKDNLNTYDKNTKQDGVKTYFVLKVGNNDSVNLENIKLIKSDLDWFNDNKNKILNLFRAKFYEAIKIQVRNYFTNIFIYIFIFIY
jgi:hypothetical protein